MNSLIKKSISLNNNKFLLFNQRMYNILSQQQRRGISTWYEAPTFQPTELVEKFGSPLWVLNESQLLSNISKLKQLTKNIYYPVKTNSNLRILSLLSENGVGVDCVTPFEVKLAQLAGIPLNKISYYSPIPNKSLLLNLLRNGGIVVLDHLDDLLFLDDACKGDFTGKVVLRVNLLEDVCNHGKASSQSVYTSKFGISIEDIEEHCKLLKNVKVEGLHIHLGTQIANIETFKKALKPLIDMSGNLKRIGHPVNLLNVGGGLGLEINPSHKFPSLDEYISGLKEMVNDEFELAIEPGRALVGNTVALLTTLEKVKDSRGTKFGVCNAGTESMAMFTLTNCANRVIGPNGVLPFEGKDVLTGPHCFAGDRLLCSTDLSGLKQGDVLTITNTGAYCLSISNHFSGFHSPAFVSLTKDGQLEMINQKEDCAFDNTIQSYCWNSAHDSSTNFEIQDVNHKSIQSKRTYNQPQDDFEYKEFKKIAQNKYKVVFSPSLNAKEDELISAPSIVRMAEDASIIACLDYCRKDVSVLRNKIILNVKKELKNMKNLTCTFSLSNSNDSQGKNHVFVHYDFENGSLTGYFEIVSLD